MAQTNLKTDLCGYNQSASRFYWTFQPDQYKSTYVLGEVGVPAGGGSAGSYVRPSVIDISSFLSGRDDILTKCIPPTPSLEELHIPELNMQTQSNASILLPKYTKTKRSANDLDSVDYNRWQPNLPVEPQNPRFVIEGFANERGGMNTRNYTKLAWRPGSFTYTPGACETVLRPGLTGQENEKVTGYPGVNPITGQKKFVNYKPPGKPPGQPDYPFVGITSQQIVGVGADNCGPQFFGNLNNTPIDGGCPVINPTMLQNDAKSLEQFPVPF